MRQLLRLLITALFAALLAACGGEARPQALVGHAEPRAPLTAQMELKTP